MCSNVFECVRWFPVLAGFHVLVSKHGLISSNVFGGFPVGLPSLRW